MRPPGHFNGSMGIGNFQCISGIFIRYQEIYGAFHGEPRGSQERLRGSREVPDYPTGI